MPVTLSHWDSLLASRTPRRSRRAQNPHDQSEGRDIASFGDLALSFFDSERPLQGAAGLVDWRLRGQLSGLIRSGHSQGKLGESLMMPAGRALPFSRIFLYGLGSEADWSENDFCAHAQRISESMFLAGATRYALQLPGRSTQRVSARFAVETWIEMGLGSRAQVTIVDSPRTYLELRDLLRED